MSENGIYDLRTEMCVDKNTLTFSYKVRILLAGSGTIQLVIMVKPVHP